MTYASLSGERIVSGSVLVPTYGIWAADVVLATTQTIPHAVTLVIGNLTLQGTIFRAASFAGSRSARVVGGAAGWRTMLGAQAYNNPGGVKLSTVMGDAASAVGEKVNVVADQNLGEFFIREAAPAQRLLRQLCGPLWWIDPAGVTQIGATRATDPITSEFQLIERKGGKGYFEVATESPGDWMPGRSFIDINIKTAKTISLTTFTLEESGVARLTVLSTP